MAECVNCGTIVASPLKTWSMHGRPSKTGRRFKLTIGLYKCPTCEKKFRVVLGKEKTTINTMIGEIKGIEKGLMQTLRNLREKIEKLEKEKITLLGEIDTLKKIGEAKANTLEDEVSTLRKEVNSLRELLGSFK